MAEGILKLHAGNQYFCDSCGIYKQATDTFILQIMDEIGVDMRAHNPKSFEDLQDFSFDMIVALSENAYAKAQRFSRINSCEVKIWRVPDPSLQEGDREHMLEGYRNLRDILMEKIKTNFCDEGIKLP